MNERPRISIAELTRHDLPSAAGAYAIYRDGEAIYVGKASDLKRRVYSAHCGQSMSLRNSAFRRNVAEHLGIASAADIYSARYALTPDELTQVRGFVESCEVAWLERETDAEAIELETDLKLEYKPSLTKV